MKIKLLILRVCSFLVSIAPLAIIFILRGDTYLQKPYDAVKLTIGGVLIVIFLIMKVTGKLKMPRRIVLFFIVFIMSYLLKNIMDDIILISGMALAGEFVDYVAFQYPIKKLKERITIGKTADATAEKIEQVMKKYVGGRV